METNVKEQIIKSVKSIKNKIKLIQDEEDTANIKYQKVFKPIIDPLKSLIKVNENENSTSNNGNVDENYKIGNLNSSLDSNISKDITDSDEESEYYSEGDKSPSNRNDDTLMLLKKEDFVNIYDNINIPFGIRSENKKLMIGNSNVKFSVMRNTSNTENAYTVTINNKHYEFTPGLKELLVRSKPNLALVTEKDKINYKEILHYTNAHKRDFHPNGQIKGDKGAKYRQIIKPLFSEIAIPKTCSESSVKTKIGGGYISKYKKYKPNTDYIYWDDPNELIERLKLLIASQSAGNTNHDNEIISIIEELKEAGIIK